MHLSKPMVSLLTFQCFTILLRPFFSKELSLRLQGVEPNHLVTKLSTVMRQRIDILRKEGIQAARNNCKILIDLLNRGKYGRSRNHQAKRSLTFCSQIRVLGLCPRLQQPLYHICCQGSGARYLRKLAKQWRRISLRPMSAYVAKYGRGWQPRGKGPRCTSCRR